MDTFTNPIGDPNTDFFKETLVEKILTEVENEVYWKLLRLPRDDTPLLTDVYDTKTGFQKGFRHAPYCRCVFCPFNDLNYAKNLHKRKLSPFNDWNLDPTESYLLHGSIKKHFLFCQCEMCLRKPISFIINSAKMVGKLNLMKSSLRRGDLSESNPGYQERNMKKGLFYPYKMEEKFDINVWKMNSVEWIVDSIEKRRRHRIEQMEFVQDREPEYNLGCPKMCYCLSNGSPHKI